MKKILQLCCALGLFVSAETSAQTMTHRLNKPFGWANCTSLTQADSYNTIGAGNTENAIVLKSTGEDMRDLISNAIKKYDLIVFDGSQGDFIVSRNVDVNGLENKTMVGINGARLCSKFYLTPEIHKALNDAKVKKASSSKGTGGTLSNGNEVAEARERLTRQTLIDLTGDTEETFRRAGVLSIKNCNNIVVRNIKFVGPGPCDVGGNDLLTVTRSTHLWVDHCDFTDGQDGNFDISNASDFVTVSWCTFSYTERAYDHMNTNLVGGSDNHLDDLDKLNITYAFNIWGKGCNQRMPMVRFGTVHVLNNYYDCAGSALCVNARKESEVLVEGNYFEKGVKKPFEQKNAKSFYVTDNHYTETFKATSNSLLAMPYTYTFIEPDDIRKLLTGPNGAGATLTDPLNYLK